MMFVLMSVGRSISCCSFLWWWPWT